MGNFHDRYPNETYSNARDLVLCDVINDQKWRKPNRGDMIQFHRGRYEHWAVYIGDEKVIQVTVDDFGCLLKNMIISACLIITTLGEETAIATVTEESYWNVLGDGVARINNFKDRDCLILQEDEIISCARNALGRQGYHVLSNNCEHLTTECRYGIPMSGQRTAFWSTTASIVRFALRLTLIFFLIRSFTCFE